MRAILLAASASFAALVVTLPAQAQSSSSGAFVARPPVTVHHGGSFGDFRRDFDRRRGRDLDGFVYFDDREYQGDTLWRPGSFNDWWHDRPDRSLPRWVRNNQDCQRMYWAGGGWRC